jgi:ATP-dependent RNA helicase RhlE
MTQAADSAARRHGPPASSFSQHLRAGCAPQRHCRVGRLARRLKEFELTNENHVTSAELEGFTPLGITGVLLKATEAAGLTEPKPIQVAAIPPHLAGRDVLGVAQTGSGKTAAFALPILSKIIALGSRRKPRTVRALVLAPTRELAVQIEETFRVLSKGAHVSTALVLGGVSRNTQVKRLHPGVDVLVATPGRLMDLVRERDVDLSETTWLVLDEADRMLDMGFLPDVRRIAKATHAARQTAMFSATMPPEIADLAQTLLRNPVRVDVAPQGTAAGEIVQSIVMARTKQKRKLLSDMLADAAMSRVIVFARTKHGADRVARDLGRDGIDAAVIHGNKSQGARQKALNGFRDGNVRILVATDIAARGIDVIGVSHVVNFDLPDEAESYVHRIGRTGRNGAAGIAVTLVDPSENAKLRQVERIIRMKLPVTADHLDQPDPVRSAADRAIAANDDQRDAEHAQRHGSGRGRPGGGRPARPQGARPPHGKPAQGKPSQGRGGPGKPQAPAGRPFGDKSFADKVFGADGMGTGARRPEAETRSEAARPADAGDRNKRFRPRRRGQRAA